MRLYELAAEYHNCLNIIDDLELSDDAIINTLEELALPLHQKIENTAFVIRNLEATAKAIKEAESDMSARRKAIENRATRIREFLKKAIEFAGIVKPIDYPFFKIAIRENPTSVVIDNYEMLLDSFFREPPPPARVVDKIAISKMIKSGESVAGAHLEKSTRLEIK